MHVLRAGALLLLCAPGIAAAFVAVETDQSQPYETVPVEATPGEERRFLGELTGHPIMYEVSADDPFTFTAAVTQPADRAHAPFSLILVRQNDRGGGVREVARMNDPVTDWTRERDTVLGFSLVRSPVLSADVEAGTYRVEISTPENAGQFMLTIGDQPAAVGYLDRLQAVRQVQAWFGYGLFGLLGSQLVYQPLAVLLLLFLLYKTWQYRHVLRPAQSHGPAA